MRNTYANGLLWALGNGLVSTMLVVYLALELGAGSVAIAWLLAAPRIAGVLRLSAPALLRAGSRFGVGRKPICLIGFLLSGLMLFAVPAAAWGINDATPEATRTARIAMLAFAWCIYHVLQYLASVALWSWIGDLYPRRLRSRLLGVRERWLTLGSVGGVAASIALTLLWQRTTGNATARVPLATSAATGSLMMLWALVPLAQTSSYGTTLNALPEAPWRTLRRALAEKPYRRLMAYSCWFGFANGLSATAQGMYPKAIGIDYARLQTYQAGMWMGQSAIAPWCGRMVARHGAKRVLLPAQLLVATGPLWYWMASPEQPGWIAVAWLVWIGYAAINVGLDTLKLNLANPTNNTPYLAVYHAVSDLVNASTVLMGGLLFETLKVGDSFALRVYAGLFLAGWACRTLATALIPRLVEPDTHVEGTME